MSSMSEAMKDSHNLQRVKWTSRLRFWVPRLLILSFMVAAGLVCYFKRELIKPLIKFLMVWIEENPVASPFVLSCAISLTVLLMGPYSALANATGYSMMHIYPRWITAMTIGVAITFFGAYIGGVLAFYAGRYLCRSSVQKLADRREQFQIIEKSVEAEGRKIICLLRLSILVPYNVTNYILGGSAVTISDYLFGTLFILPNCLFNVYVGTTIRNIEDAISGEYDMDRVQIVVYALGGAIGVGGIIFCSVMIYKQLQKQRQKLQRVSTIHEKQDLELQANNTTDKVSQFDKTCSDPIKGVSEASTNVSQVQAPRGRPSSAQSDHDQPFDIAIDAESSAPPDSRFHSTGCKSECNGGLLPDNNNTNEAPVTTNLD